MNRFTPPPLKKSKTVDVTPEKTTVVLPPPEAKDEPTAEGGQGKFFVERYTFAPANIDQVRMSDLVTILAHMGLVFTDPAAFKKMPEGPKKFFMCLERSGKVSRYGSREYDMSHPTKEK